MNEKKDLKNKGKLLKPTIWIGKNGVSEAQVKEIHKQLKIRKLIKVKLLKNIQDRKEKDLLVGEIIAKTGAELIDQVGSILVIYKNNDS